MLPARQNATWTHVADARCTCCKSTNMGNIPTGVAVISLRMVTANSTWCFKTARWTYKPIHIYRVSRLEVYKNTCLCFST
jgi:hypothetical protein